MTSHSWMWKWQSDGRSKLINKWVCEGNSNFWQYQLSTVNLTVTLLAWENSGYFETPSLVWETSAEIIFCWCVTASVRRSGQCFWLVVQRGKFASANQKRYPDPGSDASLVWTFCARFSGVVWRWKRRWCLKMSAVFSRYHPVSSTWMSPGLSERSKQGFETPVNHAGCDVRPRFTVQMITSLGGDA